jgi:hypothetical protein
MAYFFQTERSSRPFPTPLGAAILGMMDAFRVGPVNHLGEFSEIDKVLGARSRRSEARANVDRLLR